MDERNCQTDELQRITLDYVEGCDRGDEGVLEELLRTYPQYASDLVDFAVGYHLTDEVGCDETALDAVAQDQLATEHRLLDEAFTQMRYPPALTSLLARARQCGYDTQALSAELDLGIDVVVKLEQRIISTPPGPLLERLANIMAVSVQQLLAFFAQPLATATPASTFYYAAQPPTVGQQQSFAEAISTSRMMNAEQKAMWLALLGEQSDSKTSPSPYHRPRTRRGR